MIVANSLSAPTVPQLPVIDEAPNSTVLHGVTWKMYQAVRNDEANNHLRMIFDSGTLEIMSPKNKHGKVITLLGLMIYEWASHCRIPLEPGGNMTCDREDMEKGLEPDLCYWIAHEAVVREKDDIDFQVDPPPDLALEVEVTRSAIPKLPIYEALRIPEVWRWRRGIEVLHLNDERRYESRSQSVELPGFPLILATEFLQRRNTVGQMELMKQFVTAIKAASESRSSSKIE